MCNLSMNNPDFAKDYGNRLGQCVISLCMPDQATHLDEMV